MRYLADILTFSRIILAFIIWFLALFGGSPDAALILFLLAELTDAFDGTCAQKWPFRKGQEPKYRQYAVKYDMFADVFLWFVAVLFITLQIDHVFGMSILWATLIIAAIIELVVYGKLFGHPDDCTPNSLCKRNFPLAKKLILSRRAFYLATIVAVAVYLLLATSWALPAKITVLIISLLVGVFLWFFLRQRRQNISRNAVKLEQRLSKVTKKSPKA